MGYVIEKSPKHLYYNIKLAMAKLVFISSVYLHNHWYFPFCFVHSERNCLMILSVTDNVEWIETCTWKQMRWRVRKFWDIFVTWLHCLNEEKNLWQICIIFYSCTRKWILILFIQNSSAVRIEVHLRHPLTWLIIYLNILIFILWSDELNPHIIALSFSLTHNNNNPHTHTLLGS